MKALITLTDVEPAVRLNALLEQTGITTELVSPLDDIRGVLERFEPDVVVITISHSGSTIETLTATRLAKEAGALFGGAGTRQVSMRIVVCGWVGVGVPV